MNTFERKIVAQRNKIFQKIEPIVGKFTTRDFFLADTLAINFEIDSNLFFYIVKSKRTVFVNNISRIFDLKRFDTFISDSSSNSEKVKSISLNSLDIKMFANEIRIIEDFKKNRQVKLDD